MKFIFSTMRKFKRIPILVFFGFILAEFVCKKYCEAAPGSPPIKLENGQYNGVVIAIDEDKIDPSECRQILQNLKTLLPILSDKLYQATDNRSSFGQINILLPQPWHHTACGITAPEIVEAEKSLSYHKSHIKLTKSHPMTATDILPWTSQYRPCGEPSDSIVVPLPFLVSDPTTRAADFTDSFKAQLMLHEWTKFRYGAFDEIGYDDGGPSLNTKNPFPPCYTFGKQALLTSCTNSPELYPIAADESACTSDFVLRYKVKLEQALGKGSTSLMSSPYLDSVTHYCNKSTHNPWSLTKQNVYCDRKSVGEVVFSHPDFNELSPPAVQLPLPELRYFQHQGTKFRSGYAFVIEDTPEMRDHYKIQHISQAMAQFLQILDDNTPICLFMFKEDSDPLTKYFQFTNSTSKAEILKYIYEPNNTEFVKKQTLSQNSSRTILPIIIDHVVSKLNSHKDYFWNVFLFSDSAVDASEMSDAIEMFQKKNSSHSMSIFTFQNETNASKADPWLQWYGIPNTKNVLALPYCVFQNPPGGPCSFQTSSFIVDQFVGILNEQQYDPRFIQRAAYQVVIENKGQGHSQKFTMQGYDTVGDPSTSKVKNVYFFITVPGNKITDPTDFIRLIPPSGACSAVNLLGYNAVLEFIGQNCTLSGQSTSQQEWTLEVFQAILPGPGSLLLNTWVELEDVTDPRKNNSRLVVTTSIGKVDLKSGFDPNDKNIPVFVALETPQGYPVLEAEVKLQVYHPGIISKNLQSKQITLLDDGNDHGGSVDQTENDGIYSAYLNGFSQNYSTFHIVQLQITTSHSTKYLESIQSSTKAILLDERLTRKCCGKNIRALSTKPLQPQLMNFQTLHLGFKTIESWTEVNYPPEEIKSITVSEQTKDSISVQFLAVVPESSGGSDEVKIENYEACCVQSNSTLSTSEDESVLFPPGESDCKSDKMKCDGIQSPGILQTCSISKQVSIITWASNRDLAYYDILICGLRAVNTKQEYGPVSKITFEVHLTDLLAALNLDVNNKCEKFSLDEECVPIWIFWVMIGCLGLLLLIIVVILSCICCRFQKKNKRHKSEIRRPTTEARENVLAVHYTPPPSQPTANPKNQNARDRDDDDRQKDDSKVVKELFVNHAYIQDGDGEIKIIADNGQILRKPKTENDRLSPPPRITSASVPPPAPSRQQQQLPPETGMQVFKPVPMPKSERTVRPPNKEVKSRDMKRRGGERPEIIHPNPMLRSDSSYNNISMPSKSPPPITSSDPALVYATLSRAGHIKPPRQITFDPHYMVPHNSSSVAPVPPPQAFQRQAISRDPLPRSPPQMPNYPRESDTDETSTTDYYGGSRGQQQRARRLPPRFTKPPPYPAGSQLLVGNQNNQRHFGGRGLPVPTSPVGENPPPVPPPRYDRPPPAIRSQNNNTSVQNFSGQHDMMSTDEDSDEWDDGDNNNYGFDNTTGVSYA